MTNVLVLGASGRIARHVIDMLGDAEGVQLTLFLRDKNRAPRVPPNGRLVEGDALDPAALASAVQGQDVVYANLTGEDLDDQALAILDAMGQTAIQRLIFVLALGIYDEVPGEFGHWNRQQLGDSLAPFRRAAAAIEASDLDFTLIRPAWLTDDDEIDYETTQRHEPFRGTEVSRKSVAALIVDTITNPAAYRRASLGVDKPDTDGPKPAFM